MNKNIRWFVLAGLMLFVERGIASWLLEPEMDNKAIS